MPVRLHILGRTEQLTFPIGVCVIALAFRGKAVHMRKRETMDPNHYLRFHGNINVDTKGGSASFECSLRRGEENNKWVLNKSG